MTSKRITAHVGSMDDMAKRFVVAWKEAKSGAKPMGEHITFVTLESLVSVMSPKRLELLRALRASGPSSIRALSTALARDYKSVHTDVVLLADAGLIKRNKDGLVSAPWDKVQAELLLAS
jgi:predicted transcriptional regulator